MGIFRPPGCRTFRYNFRWRGRRHNGSTGQLRAADAREWLREYRVRLARQAGDLPAGVDETPRFTDWAEVYFAYASQRVTRPERLEDLIRVVLRFCGGRPSGANPKMPIVPGEPYHNLRLGHPVHDSDWLLQFEDWLARCRVGPQTRNHYRSILSRMYRVALLPQYRKQTGVAVNPFAALAREQTTARQVTISVAELQRWIAGASYHVRLAVAIGALAPKLRKEGILALEWDAHLDPELTRITVHQHKTAHRTRAPQVVYVSDQLRVILEDARRRNTGRFVVGYHGSRVKDIRHGLQRAAVRAGLTYGRDDPAGITFHTLRHSMSTLLAELGIEPLLHMQALGHRDFGTTLKYTHLRPRHQIPVGERLSQAVSIASLVTQPHRRARAPERAETPVSESVSPTSGDTRKTG